jgi:hypothetical protein
MLEDKDIINVFKIETEEVMDTVKIIFLKWQ